jgi:membrane associated rhomboid family serine protease
MIPLKDHLHQAPPPYINYCLITLNFLVFAWELSLGFSLPKAAQILGFIPARLVGYVLHSEGTFAQAVMPLITSLFLHGNILHFLPNMCFLFLFGGKVEDALGPGRYLWFYLAGGVGACLIYLLFAPASAVPLIGASGAIAAVMAAYFSLFPEEKLSALLIIVWVLLQFFYATFTLVSKSAGQAGMAWWAHVGGFLLGLVLIHLLAPSTVRLLPFRSRPQKPPEG